MVYNDQTQKWEKAPEPVDLPAPGKGDSTEKQEKAEKAVQLKSRSETEEGKYRQWIGESEAGGVEASNRSVNGLADRKREGCKGGKEHCRRK